MYEIQERRNGISEKEIILDKISEIEEQERGRNRGRESNLKKSER